MRNDLRILSVPVLALGILILLITVALRQFSIDLSTVETIETSNLQYLGDNAVETLLHRRLRKVDNLAQSAALEQLVLAGNITEIADSLNAWKKSLELPVLAYFDPESNTLHLPEVAGRAGEFYGIADKITEQLDTDKSVQQTSFAMFRGQPSWLKSSAISIAGQTRGLFISGVKLDQGLISEMANLTGHVITLNKQDGGVISSQDLKSALPKHKLTLALPQQLQATGYRLTLHYTSLSPYRNVSRWPSWGLLISGLLVLISMVWIFYQLSKEKRQWQRLVAASKSPKALGLIPVKGLPKQLATNLARQTEENHALVDSLRNSLNKKEVEHENLIQKLQRAKTEKGLLQQAPKVKSGFMSRMGDEITSPLKSVSSMLKLLSGLKLAEEPKEIVDIARRSHQMLASNIDNILDLSKLDASMLKLFPADFDIKVLITELHTDLQPHALSKELKLEWNINERVPASCFGDRQRVHQVLYNLAGNAIRFTKDGSVGIYVDMLYEKGRQYIRFTVTDTGIGIPKPAQDSLFESFESHSRLTTSSFAGRLRLIVSKKLTKLMGGNIGVVSEMGKGSRFWFSIRYQNPKGQ